MKKLNKPFFSRFLETQERRDIQGGIRQTLKYPSDQEEPQTYKFPSDSDEA